MPNKHHHSPIYRIAAIALAYLLFGAAIFVPLGAQKEPNVILLVVLLCVWFAALIATIVVNEIRIKKKYGGDFLKKEKDEDEGR